METTQEELEILKQVGFVGDTVTILHGKALEQKYPNVIVIEGDIHTVKNFVEKRYSVAKDATGLQHIDKDKIIVKVDREAMSIELDLDAESPFGGTVKGSLEFAEELKQFKFNEGRFQRKDFVKLLKFNKRFFFDESEIKKLIEKVETFVGTANVGIAQSENNRGNKQTILIKRFQVRFLNSLRSTCHCSKVNRKKNSVQKYVLMLLKRAGLQFGLNQLN